MIILLIISMMLIFVSFIFVEINHFYELYLLIIILHVLIIILELFNQLKLFYGNLMLMCFFHQRILFYLIVGLNLIYLNAFSCLMICLSCFMSLLECISLGHVTTVSYTTCHPKMDYSYAC